jgi:hypothetical protein
VRRHGILADDAVQQRWQLIGDERLFSGEHLIGDHGEGKLIGPALYGVALDLFGRHVIGRAHHDSVLSHLLGKNFGHAKIRDFCVRALVNQDVGRLDIPMHNAFFVGVIEANSGLPEDGERDASRYRFLTIEDLLERRPVDEFHEDVSQAVLFRDIVDRYDVRMREDAGRLRLPEKALPQPVAFAGVGEVRQANGFNRDGSAYGRILSAIDHPGGAPPELA